MEVFDHDDAAFARWRERHPDGYVANVRLRGSPLLHRVACPTLRQAGEAKGRVSTVSVKACAADPAELVAWARARGKQLAKCAICAP